MYTRVTGTVLMLKNDTWVTITVSTGTYTIKVLYTGTVPTHIHVDYIRFIHDIHDIHT